jgi:ABC-type Fe3+ transport system substrate-binding protein
VRTRASTPSTTTNFGRSPRDEGRPGFWVGDYWGVTSFGVNGAVISNPPKSWKDLLKPEYKNKVALNGSPLSSGSAVAGVFSASIANGGGLSDIGPGIDFFAQLKSAGNFLPVQATPQTIASGQTPITIDWDYLNLAYGKNFPASKITTVIPSDAVYGAYYCQGVNATAPHPWAARLWQEFLYSDQGQLLWLKGFSHPALFTDMVGRKVVPRALIQALPAASIYAKVKFAAAQTRRGSRLRGNGPKVGAAADLGRSDDLLRRRAGPAPLRGWAPSFLVYVTPFPLPRREGPLGVQVLEGGGRWTTRTFSRSRTGAFATASR